MILFSTVLEEFLQARDELMEIESPFADGWLIAKRKYTRARDAIDLWFEEFDSGDLLS